jgi:hypothetical protein
MKPEARWRGGPVGWSTCTFAVPVMGGLVLALAASEGRAAREARYSAGGGGVSCGAGR